jgi:hypothetical protein
MKNLVVTFQCSLFDRGCFEVVNPVSVPLRNKEILFPADYERGILALHQACKSFSTHSFYPHFCAAEFVFLTRRAAALSRKL